MSAAKFCERKWQLLVLTPPVIFISASRHCSYSTVFPLRCRDDAISYTRFFYAHTSYSANFARVEKLRFSLSLAFLYMRFNFFYVKYHASAACHGEINFSKLPSTWFAREKLSRLKHRENSVRGRNKGRKSPREWNIVFVVQTPRTCRLRVKLAPVWLLNITSYAIDPLGLSWRGIANSKDITRGIEIRRLNAVSAETRGLIARESLSVSRCTRSDVRTWRFGSRRVLRARWLHTLIVQRRMLHYVHMLDMPAASIESFARLPNDA